MTTGRSALCTPAGKGGARAAPVFLLVLLIGFGGLPAALADPPGPVLPKMMDDETVKRIDRGLKFLTRTQRANGGWMNRPVQPSPLDIRSPPPPPARVSSTRQVVVPMAITRSAPFTASAVSSVAA